MGVEKKKGEEGQSVIEFVLLLPLMVGMTVMLVRINTAIQMSIVDQQYARAQTLWLAFNSPVYPQLRLLEDTVVPNKFSSITLGVSDNVAPDPSEGQPYQPIASTQNITRQPHVTDSDPHDGNPTQRSLVRVRDTVTMCTQPNFLQSGTEILPLTATSPYTPSGPSTLTDSSRFAFCNGQGVLE